MVFSLIIHPYMLSIEILILFKKYLFSKVHGISFLIQLLGECEETRGGVWPGKEGKEIL